MSARLAKEDFCYLTTTGRVTGRPHTIEIWFALNGRTLYMLSGGGASADWVKNSSRNPAVTVRIAGSYFSGYAPREDALARELVVGKYQPGYADDLTEWGRTSLLIAVDLDL